jgi:Sep-tRNA:Cys-tRNA synthetase
MKRQDEMNIRARKIYEALFALEDLREIFRQALPTGLDKNE